MIFLVIHENYPLDDFTFQTVEDLMNHKKVNELNDIISKKRKQAFCLKALVSKKKKRFRDETLDLDLSYITKRIIAMGIPAVGYESIYRNNLKDVVNFVTMYHPKNAKVQFRNFDLITKIKRYII